MTEISIKSFDSHEFNAYIAAPSIQTGPGLIIAQEIFGVNAPMRAICDFYATQGYIAVCPDLYWRQEPNVAIDDQVPDAWPHAFELYKNFDIEAGIRDLLATLAFMRRYQGCSGVVGSLGFGLGGKLSYLMGTRSDVECSVAYYGTGIETALDEVSDIRMPMLMHVADRDKFVPPAAQQRILHAVARNPVIQTEVYEGCEHAFARVGTTFYNEVAAKKAEEKTLVFMSEFLKDKVNG